MTTIYFVRHAEPDSRVHDDRVRPLTPKGMRDAGLVTDYLKDKGVGVILSSPFQRAADTVRGLAGHLGLPIQLVEDFREREVGAWVEDFAQYARQQWDDFDYRLPGGESLREVQERNVSALNRVLAQYPDQTIVVGSHGTAISTLLHHFDPSFGYDDFAAIKNLMPWIVKFSFGPDDRVGIEKIDLFSA